MSFGEDDLEEVQNLVVEEYKGQKGALIFQRIEEYIENGNVFRENELEDFELENYVKRFGPKSKSELKSRYGLPHRRDNGKIFDIERETSLKVLDPETSNTNSKNSFRTGCQPEPVVFHPEEYPEIVVDKYLEANGIELDSSQENKNPSSLAAHKSMLKGRGFSERFVSKGLNVLKYRDPNGWYDEALANSEH